MARAHARVCVLVTQLCPTLSKPMDCSPPGSSDHGVLQVRILEWVPIPFSRGYSQLRDQSQVFCRWILYHLSHQGSPESSYAAAAKWLQSCPTLCDPIDGSPPGSAVPGTLQARTLEWGAIAFSSYKTERPNFPRKAGLTRPSVSWGLFITLLLSIADNRYGRVTRIHLWPGARRLGG